MANGNVLVNALRGSLTPLVLEQQRQQQLEAELSANEQRAQLQALLEAFRQQGRSQLQSQRDAAALERTGVKEEGLAERREQSSADALARALRTERVKQRGRAREKRRDFRRGAGERERKRLDSEALREQRGASARASNASAAALEALREQRIAPDTIKILETEAEIIQDQIASIPQIGATPQQRLSRSQLESRLGEITDALARLSAPQSSELQRFVEAELAAGVTPEEAVAGLIAEGIPESEARMIVRGASGTDLK